VCVFHRGHTRFRRSVLRIYIYIYRDIHILCREGELTRNGARASAGPSLRFLILGSYFRPRLERCFAASCVDGGCCLVCRGRHPWGCVAGGNSMFWFWRRASSHLLSSAMLVLPVCCVWTWRVRSVFSLCSVQRGVQVHTRLFSYGQWSS